MTRQRITAFPDGFLWGAATSAYQIEGSPLADGAGPSNWHRFTHTPGLVPSGETGDVACDHYRRFADDVALMRQLGLNAYRFSVSWSRVLPQGRGQVNSRGLDFYRRLVDELVASGIRPLISLYHWDLPAALDDRGGWLNRDSAEWFADYAQVMFDALDDRVEMWTTLNEPWVGVDGGYLHGVLAPLGPARHRRGGQHRAQGSGLRQPRGRRRGGACRGLHEPPRARSGDPRQLPGRVGGHLRRSLARPARRRPRADPAAAGFPGHQLLHAQRHAPRPPDAAGARQHGAPAPPRLHRDRLGVLSAGPRGGAALVPPPLWRPAALRHRERRRLLRPADRERRARGPAAPRLPEAPSARRRRRPGTRRRPPRLFRLVAARQLRVDPGLRQALRHRARRLRDPAAHAESQRPLLRRRHPHPRRRSRRRRLTRLRGNLSGRAVGCGALRPPVGRGVGCGFGGLRCRPNGGRKGSAARGPPSLPLRPPGSSVRFTRTRRAPRTQPRLSGPRRRRCRAATVGRTAAPPPARAAGRFESAGIVRTSAAARSAHR